MTVEYKVPPKKAEPVQRYRRIEDPAEIAAMLDGNLRAPIGKVDENGTAWAENHSLRQHRRLPVEFDV